MRVLDHDAPNVRLVREAAMKSRINLEVSFDATAETPRLSEKEIAANVATYLAATMDAANVVVAVNGAVLDYRAAYEALKAVQRDPAWGNPDTDALN